MSSNDEARLILVIEDDPIFLAQLRLALRRLGHHVFTAADVAQAEEIWARAGEQIDLVVCDQNLGFDHGASLIQRFKAQRSDVKVVLCSGSELEMEVPGMAFLMKPFKVSTLLDAAA